MPASVVGRDAELAALSDFLAGIPEGAATFVLEGDAGMGKTTLWRHAVDEAAAQPLGVLRAQPAESETALSFSALGDLLDPVLAPALEALPAGQRAALARALVLDDASGVVPDSHAVGVAVLNVLRALSSERALVLAVDDVQWLDPASAVALSYAVRRLDREPVGVLFARRTGLDSPLVDEVRRAPIGERTTQLEVGPISADGLHQVVRARLGTALPRPLLAEVHQASGGNPFYAIEIVRTLTRDRVTVEAGRPLPVPDSLHEAVHGRLLALPAETRDFLAAAAAHAHPTVTVTEAASGVAADGGLAPALETQIVVLDRERIRFTHPLLAAGAYETADPLRRTQIHARLAELLTDPEARAWQLAASVQRPDEAVAAVLENASEHARLRGALRPAALLLDRASELTPAGRVEDVMRRGIEAAYLHFEAGDSTRAEATLRELLSESARGPLRARALWILARIRSYEAPDEAAELFLEVVEGDEGDPRTLASAHEGVASSLYVHTRRWAEVLEHAERAVTLARELGDEALEADALISRLGAESWLGRTSAEATAERMAETQKTASERRVYDQPLIGLVEYWLFTDRADRALAATRELLERADELGDESSRPYLQFLCSSAESALGDPARAVRTARRGRQAAEQCGQPVFVAYNLAREAYELARLGDAVGALSARQRALELAPTNGYVELLCGAVRGELELAGCDPERVVEALVPVVSDMREEGVAEPEAVRPAVDLVEALVELGRRDEAVELLDWYESNARHLERASALASCARCRGLLAAQAGELEEALSAFDEALGWHAQVDRPLDRARTLLALGATQRRMKRRREARATLEDALGVFERIGAALWAERARAELKRISGRAASPGALTPAEERVANLVAQGKTNKEVAAALFVSERTVEGHLAHIFGKLGVRNRREIVSVLAPGQEQVEASSNTGDTPVFGEPLAP